MRQVKLQFPVAEDVWNFLAATRKTHVEAEDTTAEGWFTSEELKLATERFNAEVLPYTPPVTFPAQATPATPTEKPPTITAEITPAEEGQPVQLYGKSGRAYPGKIYTKAAPATPTAPALICLANSTYTEGTWQHRVNAIYATDNAEQERARFSERDDVSHLIVVPAEEWSDVDARLTLTVVSLHQ
jgi:hypothetical protein